MATAARIDWRTPVDTSLVADGLLTTPEAQAIGKCSRSALYKAMEQGMLPYVKLGRSRRIPRRAFLEFMAAGLTGGWAVQPTDSVPPRPAA